MILNFPAQTQFLVLQTKMLSSNQIAKFFDHQLPKESIDILDFLREVGSERSNWDYYFWLGVTWCTQPRPNVPRLANMPLYMARLKIGHNETLINFLQNKSVFSLTWYVDLK